MINPSEIALVALLGFAATSSNLLGAAIGLYLPISKRLLSAILAFAAGALISALAIELAYEGALELHRQGFSAGESWQFIGGGFAVGAVVYYLASLALEREGAAIRYPKRFREYARRRQQKDNAETIRLLSQCDLLRHLPPEDIAEILPRVRTRALSAGEILFRTGDIGDALYIVADGSVHVVEDNTEAGRPLAELGKGQVFGEMALLSGRPRTATIRATGPTNLLTISRDDFLDLMAHDEDLVMAVERLSHERAIKNLSGGGANPETWARIASSNLDHLSHRNEKQLLSQAADGAGLAIVFGNILDTIPGCLVIGARFTGLESLSMTLLLGMFLGGIPEAAASGTMLRKAGYRPRTIFLLWSMVLVAGVLAAIAGKVFIGNSESLTAVFCEAIAGGAVLALVAHAMIPEAIEEAGSLIVLPTVAGFLFALYLALSETFH